MKKWVAPDIAALRGDNTRPLQKIFASLTEYLNAAQTDTRVLQTYVRNAEATALTVGEVVYLYQQQGDRASVKRALNTSDATSAKTLGVVAERIEPNADGLVTTQGYVEGINLSAFTAGQTVYLHNVAGQFTATKPVAPKHLVYVGVVVRANAGNGILYVRTQNGYELDEIHDVLVSSPTQGQMLTWDASTSLWKNMTFSDGGGLTNLNASNLSQGTVDSARLSGSYTGITAISNLTSVYGSTKKGNLVTVGSGKNSYMGYSINSWGAFLMDSSYTYYGLYNDIDNYWSVRCRFGQGVDLYYGSAIKLTTGSGGVYVTGVTSATYFMLSDHNTNNQIYSTNTADTATPWASGPRIQGITGWSFYSTTLGRYTMGYRGSTNGATRYMWCQDAVLIGSAPNDAIITYTLNVEGTARVSSTFSCSGSISLGGTIYVYGAGIAYQGATIGGGSPNQIGFRWASPYVNCTVDNVISAACANFSDVRLKTNIADYDGGIDVVRQLRPISYDPLDVVGFDDDMNPIIGDDGDKDTIVGFLANDVQEIFPSAVLGTGNQLKSIDLVQIVALLTSSIQNMDKRLLAMEELSGTAS